MGGYDEPADERIVQQVHDGKGVGRHRHTVGTRQARLGVQHLAAGGRPGEIGDDPRTVGRHDETGEERPDDVRGVVPERPHPPTARRTHAAVRVEHEEDARGVLDEQSEPLRRVVLQLVGAPLRRVANREQQSTYLRIVDQVAGHHFHVLPAASGHRQPQLHRRADIVATHAFDRDEGERHVVGMHEGEHAATDELVAMPAEQLLDGRAGVDQLVVRPDEHHRIGQQVEEVTQHAGLDRHTGRLWGDPSSRTASAPRQTTFALSSARIARPITKRPPPP